jgi:hypothetical protein
VTTPGHASTAGFLTCGDRLVFIATPLLRCINDTCCANCLLLESPFNLQEDLNKWHPFIEERIKGHGNMRPIFRSICINRFDIGPLHYISSCSDFGFEFVEIFVIKIQLPETPILRLGESGSRRISDLVSRGVADSPTRRVGESATPRLGKSDSRLLNAKTPLFGESL